MTWRAHPIYAEMQPTIFEHMSGLARKYGALNLGQGFPDEAPLPELIAAATQALAETSHQYPPAAGLPELRQAVAGYYRREQGLDLAAEQVVVTSGATEALAAAILALVEAGDEVILFQPAYDSYAPMILRAGGVPVSVHLTPPELRYEAGAIEAAITPKTKAMIVNDPLNPLGKMMSAAEMQAIADMAVRHDLVLICDEVWEDVRLDGPPHVSFLALPQLRDRVVKIGSAGKIFGLTGWKIGWMCGSTEMMQILLRAHQFLTFTTPPALQWAVAEGLGLPRSVLDAQRAGWKAGRDILTAALEAEGFQILPSAATWFLNVDLAASGIALDDRSFAERAVAEFQVASTPVSALWAGQGPRHLLRLCFTKDAASLVEAAKRLGRFRAKLIA